MYVTGESPLGHKSSCVDLQVREPLSSEHLQSRRSRTWGFKSLSEHLSESSYKPIAAPSNPGLGRGDIRRQLMAGVISAW